ncbi:DALR anticodon binding domain protein, partial [Sutterella parvirubra YIT 11816]
EAAVKAMIDSGRTYEAENALWLKTTSFEDLGHGIKDDKDRVMRKADGTYTYFVPDVAYHLAKFERGFTKAVNIQGTDHHGTIARVRAGLQAAGSVMGLAIPKEFPEYILHKMLSVIKDGEPVKMSKRSGNYVTLHDLVEWAGRDAARFFLVSRKSDAEFVFDVTLAQQKSDENPVYYLQYAHARICSVFAKALEQGYAVPSDAELAGADLSALTGEAAGQLLAAIAEYPQMLTQAARDHAPHVLCYYLKDLAAAFHAFYNAERVVVEDETERNARLALLAAARRVLANGFALLGISAPESMRREDEA